MLGAEGTNLEPWPLLRWKRRIFLQLLLCQICRSSMRIWCHALAFEFFRVPDDYSMHARFLALVVTRECRCRISERIGVSDFLAPMENSLLSVSFLHAGPAHLLCHECGSADHDLAHYLQFELEADENVSLVLVPRTPRSGSSGETATQHELEMHTKNFSTYNTASSGSLPDNNKFHSADNACESTARTLNKENREGTSCRERAGN